MILTIQQAMNRIEKDPHIKPMQEKVRRATTKEEKKKAKLAMPCFSPHGVIKNKSKATPIEEQLQEYSGYILFEFDDLEKPEQTYKTLRSDKFTKYIWYSVGGNIALLVKVDGGAEMHLENFEMGVEYYKDRYKLEADEAGKNLNRLRCMSSSPVHENISSQILFYETDKAVREAQKEFPPIDIQAESEAIIELCSKVESSGIDITATYSEWLRVGFGVAATFGEEGEDIFCLLSSNHPSYDEEKCRYKYRSLVKDSREGRSGISAVFATAARYGIRVARRTAEPCYWTITKEGVKLSLTGLKSLLEEKGFRLYRVSEGDYWLVRKSGMIIQRWYSSDLRDFVLQNASKKQGVIGRWTTKSGDEIEYRSEDLCEAVMGSARWAFSEDKIDFLKRLEGETMRASRSAINFFFKNKIVSVHHSGVYFVDYDDATGYVWKEEILDVEIDTEAASAGSHFEEFLKCICTQAGESVAHNEEKLLSIRSIIGYLLNPYMGGKKYGIILTDEGSNPDEDMGRTGKSLFGVALSKLRQTTFIQAKRTDFKSQFALQKVRHSDKLIVLNDLTKDVPLELFYNFITDGVDVERKNKDSFEVFTKVLFTMNSLLSGSGESVKDRFIEFQFTNFFSSDYSPVDHFKEWFFEDWGIDEWQRFYFFMFECCILHLAELKEDLKRRSNNEKQNYGIIHAHDELLEFKKFRASTRLEFVEWSECIKENTMYNRSDQKDGFKLVSGLENITTQKFTKWLKALAQYRGGKLEVVKKSNVYHFSIVKN